LGIPIISVYEPQDLIPAAFLRNMRLLFGP